MSSPKIFQHLQNLLTRGDDVALQRELTALTQREPQLAPTAWGMYYAQRGEVDRAGEFFLRAIALNPHDPRAPYRLAMLYQTHGRALDALPYFAAAAQCAATAPQCATTDAAANYWLDYGNAAFNVGDYATTKTCGEKVLLLDPKNADAHVLLGLSVQNDFTTAVAHYERAEQLNPQLAAHTAHLKAVAYQLGGRMFLAAEFYRTAIKLDPQNPANYLNLAGALIAQAQIKAGSENLQIALQLAPHNLSALSNWLLAAHYVSNSRAELFALAQNFAAMLARDIPAAARKVTENFATISRTTKIKVGFVSADFRQHSVAFFIEPLLQHYDREKFEFYAYFVNRQTDAITTRLQNYFTAWRTVLALSDTQLAAQIRADHIDILIDLSGHTQGHRLATFARRPARRQLTWLGYPDTTGLREIDYRVSDALADPPEYDNFSAEKIWRLDGGFHCFAPLADAPEIAPAPQLTHNFITFASFNNYAKTSDEIIKLWAEILATIPHARLLLKALALNHPETKNAVYARFAALGISAEKLTLLPQTLSFVEHLNQYQQVDIALDTFPYNGTTTTLEALWMGVPTLTLCGETHAARVGASLLTHTGLTDLITTSATDYVRRAVALAQDLPYRQKFREIIRAHLITTPIFSAVNFTRKFSTMLQTIHYQS